MIARCRHAVRRDRGVHHRGEVVGHLARLDGAARGAPQVGEVQGAHPLDHRGRQGLPRAEVARRRARRLGGLRVHGAVGQPARSLVREHLDRGVGQAVAALGVEGRHRVPYARWVSSGPHRSRSAAWTSAAVAWSAAQST